MSLQVKTVPFNIGSGGVGTTLAVNGVGFQPVAVILFATSRTENVDTGGVGDGRRMIGFAGATTQGGGIKNRVVAAYKRHNVAGSDNDQASRTDCCILAIDNGGIINGHASLHSFNGDGAVFLIGNAFGFNVRVVAWFIGGTDVSNVEIGTGISPQVGATPFTEDIVTGFTCADDQALGFLIGGSSLFGENSNDIDSDNWIGAFTSAASQFAWTGGGDNAHAAVSFTRRHLRMGTCIASFTTDLSTLVRRAQFHSWIANAFRLQWNEVFNNSHHYYWLVIKGGRWKVRSGSTATTLTTVPVIGAGFQPVGGLVVSHHRAESASDAVDAEDICSFGAFDGPASRACVAIYDRDNQASSNVAGRVEHDAVYAQIDTAGAAVGLMDVQSLDPDGVTFVMDDADPAVGFFATVLAAPAVSAPPAPPPVPNPERWRHAPRTAPVRASRW